MEPKKDNIIQKINTERGFADEIFKKYRHERYGIGSCCGSNLPSYIKDKYICDYQDAKVTPYESIKITKTSYKPPTPTGAKDDNNRPAWVDALCGISQDDAEIYFYYDTTSLGVSQVQAAYAAAVDWVDQVIANFAQESGDSACSGSSNNSGGITVYHTAVQGERWLDWGTQALTGSFNNSGSCGGNGTVDVNGNLCGTGSNVNGQPVNVDPIPGRNHGLVDCGSAADATFPQDVAGNPNPNKFWSIIKWAQDNGISMHSFGNAGETVATATLGNDTSGGIFNGYATIGQPPAATKRNLLVVCFLDESASQNHKQPYHDRDPNTTWNSATDGAGNPTPCWKADHAEFITQRNLWMSADPTRQSNFFMYPSEPQNVGNGHRPFPLHCLGAITSGDKTPLDGTLNTAPTSLVANPQLLTPITTSNPYFASGYGALDQHGWGTNVAMLPFTAATFQADLNEFVDIQSCNDSECFLFVVKDQHGNPVEDHPIKINTETIGYTDEYGLLRWCVRDASINTQHILDLCTCLTTTGGCSSQKINMTITDSRFTNCATVKPFTACTEVEETQSSGNDKQGCTDPAADNYDPSATVDDGSCTFCSNFNVTGTVVDATENSGSCANDGSITLGVVGGVAPYTYAWFGPGGPHTGDTLTGLCGGVYTVLVTDSSTPQPCQAPAQFTVNQPPSIIYGCTNTEACNYDATATNDDGSCLFSGCTNTSAVNYNPAATADCNCNPPSSPLYQNVVNWDSCCTACVDGCMDPNANNYDAAATCDDGSCTYNYSCIQVGSNTGPTTNSCEEAGLTNMGAISMLWHNFYTFSWQAPNTSYTHLPINSVYYAATTSAPVSGQCTDDNGNGLWKATYIQFGWGTTGTPCASTAWPQSWTNVGLVPDVVGGDSKLFTTESWNDVIYLLNLTITQENQQYINPNTGNPIQTFTGFDYLSVYQIMLASQGTAAVGANASSNLLIPECPEYRFMASGGSAPCECTSDVTPICECQQMTDGSGTYATIDQCQQDPSSCCYTESTVNYVCVPGGITNSCSNKQLIPTSAPVSTQTNLGDNLAQEWTSDPVNWPIVPVHNYKFYVDQGGGNCQALTGNSEWFIKEIKLTRVDTGTFVSIGDVPVANSWAILQGALAGAGYDGTTYPDLSNADYMTVKTTLATSEPGQWTLEVFEQMCNCTSDGGCDCIADPNGDYTDYQTCLTTCCQSTTNQYGCTDTTAYNYYPQANMDDGSCLYCDDIVTPIDNVTTTTVDPSSGVNDGTIVINLSTTVPNGMVVRVDLYDSSYTLVGTQDIPTGSSGTNPGFENLGQDNYTAVACLRHNTSYTNADICCSPAINITLGNPNPNTTYECIPGSITQTLFPGSNTTLSLTDPGQPKYYLNNVATWNASNTPNGYYTGADINAANAAFLDDWSQGILNYADTGSILGSNATANTSLSVSTPWFFNGAPLAEQAAGSGACLTQMPDGTNAAIFYLNYIQIKDSSNNVIAEMNQTNSVGYTDFTVLIGAALNDPNLVNASWSTIAAAFSRGSAYTYSTNFQAFGCSYDCRCEESPTGTFNTIEECQNSGCCNTGCTDSQADNYNPGAGIDIGNCIYCTNFEAVLLNFQGPPVPNGNSGNWDGATNLNIPGNVVIATGSGGNPQSYDTTYYYDGYNMNQAVDGFNLFPGRYTVCVEDVSTGCRDCISNVNVGVIPLACRSGASNWWPMTTWRSDNLINFINAGNPDFDNATNLYSYSNNINIQWGINATNTGAEGTTFWILNLNSSVTYTINVYNNATGALHQTASGVTGAGVGIANAVPGTTYDIEIIRENETCSIIGMPYTFSPPGF